MKITRYRQTLLFLWESPTLMTWGSFLTRSLSAVLILPMVLRNFPKEEITLWFMFAQIISLQLLVDMGFTPTFSRLIAHGKTERVIGAGQCPAIRRGVIADVRSARLGGCGNRGHFRRTGALRAEPVSLRCLSGRGWPERSALRASS